MRAQIELARTPPWEPFAVFCKWRRPDWAVGKPFRDTLPPVDGNGVEWSAEAFQRGLGWRLNVRSLIAWEQQEARVLKFAPVGAMHLWSAATFDDWWRFAESPVVPRLREVHFVTSPNEPLRLLRVNPAALGITDLYLERSSGPGIMFVVEDLLASPLGRAVSGLHFRMGYESLEDLIDVLRTATGLERFSFATMGLTEELAIRLCYGPALRNLRELDLSANPLGDDGAWNIAANVVPPLHSLRLSATGAGRHATDAVALYGQNLRRLDLEANPLMPRHARTLARSSALAGLRSLNLSRCRLGERGLNHLTRAKFWPNLVEIDLRENPIPPAGVRHLLDALVPADLAALVLTGDLLGGDAKTELRRKYGARVVFVASEVTGL